MYKQKLIRLLKSLSHSDFNNFKSFVYSHTKKQTYELLLALKFFHPLYGKDKVEAKIKQLTEKYKSQNIYKSEKDIEQEAYNYVKDRMLKRLIKAVFKPSSTSFTKDGFSSYTDKLKIVFSRLLSYLEDFFIQKQLDKKVLEKQILLLEYALEHKKFFYFKQLYNDFLRKIEDYENGDDQSIYANSGYVLQLYKHRLTNLYIQYIMTKHAKQETTKAKTSAQKSTTDTKETEKEVEPVDIPKTTKKEIATAPEILRLFEKSAKSLDLFLINAKLKLSNDIINAEIAINYKKLEPSELIEQKLAELWRLQTIMNDCNQGQFIENDLVNIYFTNLELLVEESKHSHKHFKDLKELLRTHAHLPTTHNLSNLYTSLLNYTADHLSKNSDYYNEYITIAKRMDDLSLFSVEGEYISTRNFKNIVVMATRVQDFIWAKQFLNKNITAIPEHSQEGLKKLCAVIIQLYEQDSLPPYNRNLTGIEDALNKIEKLDLYAWLNIKTLQLRLAYLDLTKVSDMATNYKGYVRKKDLLITNKDPYIKFANLVVELSKFERNHKLDFAKLKIFEEDFHKSKTIDNLWLQRKINELKLEALKRIYENNQESNTNDYSGLLTLLHSLLEQKMPYILENDRQAFQNFIQILILITEATYYSNSSVRQHRLKDAEKKMTTIYETAKEKILSKEAKKVVKQDKLLPKEADAIIEQLFRLKLYDSHWLQQKIDNLK